MVMEPAEPSDPVSPSQAQSLVEQRQYFCPNSTPIPKGATKHEQSPGHPLSLKDPYLDGPAMRKPGVRFPQGFLPVHGDMPLPGPQRPGELPSKTPSAIFYSLTFYHALPVSFCPSEMLSGKLWIDTPHTNLLNLLG